MAGSTPTWKMHDACNVSMLLMGRLVDIEKTNNISNYELDNPCKTENQQVMLANLDTSPRKDKSMLLTHYFQSNITPRKILIECDARARSLFVRDRRCKPLRLGNAQHINDPPVRIQPRSVG